MSFDLNISIIDVCAFVPNSDESAIHVLMPDAREASVVVDINNRLQILPAHFPYLKFRLDDLDETASGDGLLTSYRTVYQPDISGTPVGYGIWFLEGALWLDNLVGALHCQDSYRDHLICSDQLYPTAAAVDPVLLGDDPNRLLNRISARLMLIGGAFSCMNVAQNASDHPDLFKLRRQRGYLKESDGTTDVLRKLATEIGVATRVSGDHLVVRTTKFDGTPQFRLQLRPRQGASSIEVTIGNSPAESKVLLDVPDFDACHTTLDFWLYSKLYLLPPGDPFFPDADEGTDVSNVGGCCVCKRFPPTNT